MKRSLLALAVALAALVAACGGDTAAAPALTLSGPTGTVTLTMEDLKALPATEGWGGFLSSTGSITIPEQFRGVSLVELAAQVGGITEGMGLTVSAKDGYSMTLSFEQAVNGDFITYDPSTGDERGAPGPLRPIIAYSVGGQPLDDDQGPLRLEVVSDERNQVIDGHWTVKWVTGLELKAIGEEWTLGLEGLTSETLDRGTYESCFGCHRVEWIDPDGGTWEGVPLWMLAARLDGGEAHGADPYDEALAEAGYTLEVIAADGYSATLDSALFDRNDAILVAGRRNGEALPEEDFPLRLVGEGLTGREMVAQIVQIIGHFAGGTG